MDGYSIYWIHLPSERDIWLQGYVGKAKDLEKRWKRHRFHSALNDRKANKKPLYVAFRKFGLENFLFETVASNLDQNTALNLEYALRPCFGVGYNIGAGGAYSSVLQSNSLSILRRTTTGFKRIEQYKMTVSNYYQKKIPNKSSKKDAQNTRVSS